MENDLEVYRKAVVYAIERHRGQYRDGGEDFIHHPIRVGRAIRRMGYPLFVVIGGVLHDVPEETGTSIYVIRNFFGGDVAQIVDDLTQRPDEPNSDYRERLKISSKESRAVKLVDRRDNLNCMNEWNNFRILSYLSDTEMLVDALHGVSDILEHALLNRIREIRQRLPSGVKRSPEVQELLRSRSIRILNKKQDQGLDYTSTQQQQQASEL